MKLYPSLLATWMILAAMILAADNAWVSTKNDEVKIVTVRLLSVTWSYGVPSLVETPLFPVDGIFVIVIVNAVGSRTITATETDDVVERAFQYITKKSFDFFEKKDIFDDTRSRPIHHPSRSELA